MIPNLHRYHIVTEAEPYPPNQPGLTWLIAANGIFKSGCDRHQRLIIQVSEQRIDLPGMVAIMPMIHWFNYPKRLPSAWLSMLLADAQKASIITNGVARPIEKQYFVVNKDDRLKLIIAPQQASALRVHYQMPSAPIFVDIHSHHGMPAYFSATDDADDTGLSISCVIGNIYSNPEIICRLNIYGQHQVVPITTIFDGCGPFADVGQREGDRYANAQF
ncbi:MAG TPA: hypothetical protein DEF47_12445 [Herpetosiphon sp.]|uniref:JAB domain-containing protein n=2 Tax=Herpetosiphon TaxID=64 RepID=A9AVA9_HERA2|nr:hypothetical protein Haur_0539 [Herpetosiphon aurantiacus DSM 785]HBW50704.1 hypothetical protein [Herpetosiphon sp.]